MPKLLAPGHGKWAIRMEFTILIACYLIFMSDLLVNLTRIVG
ncbi:hypothetical protein [Croceicoccus sp. BE223]|nr:hypothetical protein [Croceicoccus sp. BE223]MDR7103016.1 hypothetical protein [Croceicoccus sp. BE223]